MIGGVVRLFGMKLNLLTRRTHYWATALIAVPFALVLLTGILLQLKKQLPWVQPAEMRGGKSLNWVGFQEVLGALKSRPELGIQDWRDVQRLDIRPSKGIAKAILDSGWEVQVDLENGQVLQQAIRRSDWIESLHDGSYFAGNWSKIGVFLPIAFVVLAMWITGIWMFWLPFAVKLRRKRVAAARTKPIANFLAFLVASLGAPSLETTLFASQPFTSQPNQAQPYNVVFILADDLGWAELGSYGQKKIPTPHLDRLAHEGIRFTEHYSGAPVCAPSRCVLMTGKHLGHAEIRGNLQAKVNFPDFSEGQHPISSQAFTLAEMFQRAGYKTGAFGKWGLGPVGSTGDPTEQGFEQFFGYNCQAIAHSYYPRFLWRNRESVEINPKPIPGHAKPEEGAIAAERWVGESYAPYRILSEAEAFLNKNANQAFFLYLPFIQPHVAMHPPVSELSSFPESWDDVPYRGGNGYLPHPRPRAAYAAMIQELDTSVGRILELLKQHRIEERTLVVFTSDNGATHAGSKEARFHVGGADPVFFESTADLKGYKGSVYEGGIRVPMIARLPGKIPAGSVSELPSYFADWFPTLADLIGKQTPEGLDGISLLPELCGTSSIESRPPMVWVFPEYGGQVAVRFGKHKLVRRGLAGKNPSGWELYDLESDRGERENVAERFPELVDQGVKILRSEMDENPIFPVRVPGE